MSPKLPRITAADVIHVLQKSGYTLDRQRGSHRIYMNAAGNRIVVPFHSGKILHPKILSDIIGEMGLTLDKFTQLL